MNSVITLGGTLPFPTELRPNPGAPSDLVEVFASYWEAVEWPQSRITKWGSPVASISGGEWGNDTASAAGAGGVAEVVGVACIRCGGRLTLTSRSAFDQAQRGEGVKCRDCTAHFEERVSRLGSADAAAKRAARVEGRLAREGEARQQAERSAGRSLAIQVAYGTPRGADALGLEGLGVTELVTLLTLGRFHMPAGVTIALDDDEEPLLAPFTSYDYFKAILGRQVLQVHASTPASAFVWEAEEGEGATTLSDRWYPRRLRLWRDTGADSAEAAGLMRDEIKGLLDLPLLTRTQQEELLLLGRDLLAEEGMAYLEYQLWRYKLPEVPDQHRSRFFAVMQRAADHLTLGDIYRLAWSAASAATNLYQSTPASRANSSTYALNKFEDRVSEAIADPDQLLEPYRLIDQVQISTMTRVVFMEILESPVVSASIRELREAMPTAFDVQMRSSCLEALPTLEEVSLAKSQIGSAGVGAVSTALSALRGRGLVVCSPGCSHSQANMLLLQASRQVQLLAERIGEREAEIAVVELLHWNNWRDIDNRSERPADVLLVAMRDEIFGAGNGAPF